MKLGPGIEELLSFFNCETCGGSGEVALGEHFVSHEMALDAGEPSLEGQSMGIEWGQCNCGGLQRRFREAIEGEIKAAYERGFQDGVEEEAWSPSADHETIPPLSSTDEALRRLESMSCIVKGTEVPVYLDALAALRAAIERERGERLETASRIANKLRGLMNWAYCPNRIREAAWAWAEELHPIETAAEMGDG